MRSGALIAGLKKPQSIFTPFKADPGGIALIDIDPFGLLVFVFSITPGIFVLLIGIIFALANCIQELRIASPLRIFAFCIIFFTVDCIIGFILFANPIELVDLDTADAPHLFLIALCRIAIETTATLTIQGAYLRRVNSK